MGILSSQSITDAFLVKNDLGILVNASALPTAVLFRNGIATSVVVTVTEITGAGRYSIAWTNAAFAVGDQLRVEATATVDGVAYTSAIWSGSVVADVISALGSMPTVAEISSGIASDVVNDDNDWDIVKQSLVGQIWGNTDRTLTSIADSTGMTTLLNRITGLLQTKAQADTDQAEVISAVDNVPTTEQVEEIATYSKIAAKNTQE